MGIELMTSSLPRMRSTPELHRQSLERGRRIELPFPAWKAGIIAIIRTPQRVGKDGFEPPKVKTSRFTVCPIWPLWYLPLYFNAGLKLSGRSEPMGGFEPSTPRLQITCSGQLSYIGNYFKTRPFGKGLQI